MTRNLKVLGLALIAVFAMSAVAAASASAAIEFHAESGATTVTGSQEGEDEFVVAAGKTKCTTATYQGAILANPSTTQSVSPVYSGCTAAFGTTVTVDPNGCEYKFHSDTNTVDIVCSGTNVIAVTAAGCEITIPAQTGLSGVTYTNKPGNNTTTREVTIDVALSTITYTEHNKGIIPTCAHNTEWRTDGVYNGHATVTGEANPGQVMKGIWVE